MFGWHKHQWQILSAQKMEYLQYYTRGPKTGQQFGTAEPITEILQRCNVSGCGKIMTTTVDGHWTLEELEKK